ncbi:metalloregulator ArsR/SmtB family transcription factor [Pengzhenrongella sp.]|jgi:ArsR family transcriptional regulator|uniref:metalloregulator ArsR/SmtB family transcription factor n=1 Tax=Pengzhenrongella sp. TaxID=2888820 RepID=UPI002F954FA9
MIGLGPWIADLGTSNAVAPRPADHAMSAPAAAHVAATLKALADPVRLRMLSLIAASPAGEACVCDLATVADLTQPTVSHHLKVLKDVGVLTAERRATWVFYRVAPQARRAVTTLLEAFAPATMAAPEQQAPGLADLDLGLDRVAGELAVRHPALGAELVAHTVRESYTALARGAGVRTHLLVLAERFAAQRLDDIERAARPAAQASPPQVLFVCVANAGRSQLAAALLRHHAGDAVVVRSAGSAPADAVQGGVRALLDELAPGGEAADPYPKPLTDDAVRAADVVITMGCGDSVPLLPGKRYEDWIVGDPALASPEGVRAIRDELDTRVRALLTDLTGTLHHDTDEAHR